jgi:hypothetical protein
VSAGLLVRDARAWTGDPARPEASACFALDGRFVAVGDAAVAEAAAREAAARGAVLETVDAAGRRLTPGLVDAHVHVGLAAERALTLELARDEAPEIALARIATAHAALPPGAWLVGGGQRDADWRPKADRAALDRVVGDRPACLSTYDAHGAWVSSAALAQAGVTRATPDPPGGRIGRDAAGEPDGRLYENATTLVRGIIPPPDRARLAVAAHGVMTRAAACGVTFVHGFETGSGWDLLAGLRAEGRLPQRVAVAFMTGALAAGGDALDADLPAAARLAAEADGRLFPFALKGFLDGTLGQATAHLLAPADDGSGVGFATLDAAGLAALGAAARGRGWSLALHAIGDAAVRAALDGFAAWPAAERSRLRPRIEHVQLVADDDVPRFAALGVIASMQPSHCVGDRLLAQARWGVRDERGGYAWRRLLAAGAALAFGSDAPIEPLDPRAGLAAAVRGGDPAAHARGATPGRALTLDQAFAAATRGGAFAARVDDRLGVVAPGFHADFVLWDDDPWSLPAERLATARVAGTWVDGVRIFTRDDGAV